MSWLGDLFKFESFNGKEMWKQIKDDPERIFLGAADPLSSKFWGEVTGEDYDPIVDQWGGATNDKFTKAEAQGIDTGAGKDMDKLAHALSAYFAGSWASGLGGAGGAADGAGSGADLAGSYGQQGGGLMGDMGTGTGQGMNWSGSFGGNSGIGGGSGGFDWTGSFGGSSGTPAAGGFNWQDLMKNMQGQQQGPAKQNPYAGTQQPIYDNDAEQMRVRQLAAQLRRADAEGY